MPPPPEWCRGAACGFGAGSIGSGLSDPSGWRRWPLASRVRCAGVISKAVSFMPSGSKMCFCEMRLERLAADRFDDAADPIDAGAVLPALARIEHQRRARELDPFRRRHLLDAHSHIRIASASQSR